MKIDGSGAAQAGSAPEREIIRRIEAEGALTFAEFMRVALYWPEGGYYTSGDGMWGRAGDYLTSLDMSPAFSSTIAKQVFEMWSALGAPESFHVVEVGGGRGWLLDGLASSIETLSGELYSAMKLTAVDCNPALSPAGGVRIERLRDISELKAMSAGVILSNELIDSFAVNIVLNDGSLKEIYVDFDGENFVEIAGAPSTPALAEYFEAVGVELAEGQRAEVNLGAAEWLLKAAALIEKGFIITIDYGMPARELYAPERGPTLMCHRRHKLNTNPYINIASQDITTHVDFTALVKSGVPEGLELTGFTTQKNFLLGLGILEELSPAPDLGVADADKVTHNRAIAELIMPGGMGDTFKVLVQHKGIEAPTLKGFSFKDMSSYL